MRVDLLLTDRPITPSGTGRAAPQICSSGAPTDGSQMQSVRPLDLKSGRGSGAPEITKDQPLGGGPSRKLNYIIGVQGEKSQVIEMRSQADTFHPRGAGVGRVHWMRPRHEEKCAHGPCSS